MRKLKRGIMRTKQEKQDIATLFFLEVLSMPLIKRLKMAWMIIARPNTAPAGTQG